MWVCAAARGKRRAGCIGRRAGPALATRAHAVAAASGGIALATGNLGLKLAPKDNGTVYLAAASLVSAVAGGITPVLAGSLAEWFATRNLSLLVRWVSPGGTRDMSVMAFAHWEFLFALSALAGLLVLHVLSRLDEGTEISERRVVQEIGLETLRTVSQLSSLGGVLALLFPAGTADRADPACGRLAQEAAAPRAASQ